MTTENALTPEGYADLSRELDTLNTIRRPEIVKKLTEAVAEGDLKENANYHDAKEQLAFIEGRIRYLEHTLKTATIIHKDGKTDVVSLGSQVTIVEEGFDEEETYSIVGAAEANPSEGKISNRSPIGAALLGAKKGEKVRVKTPNGDSVFRIKKIQ